MKIRHYFIAALFALTLVYCKSTKKTVVAAPTPAPPPAPTVTVAPPGDAGISTQLAVAKKRWPTASQFTLDEGKTIYTTKCTTCHKAYKIEEFSEKKWQHEIDDMSPKAKLSDAEKAKLTVYILSYRELKAEMAGPGQN